MIPIIYFKSTFGVPAMCQTLLRAVDAKGSKTNLFSAFTKLIVCGKDRH